MFQLRGAEQRGELWTVTLGKRFETTFVKELTDFISHNELSQRSDFSSKASESNSASAFPFHLQVKLFKKVCESAQRAEPG